MENTSNSLSPTLSTETINRTPPRPPRKRKAFSRIRLFQTDEMSDENARCGFGDTEDFKDDLVIDTATDGSPKLRKYWDLCKLCKSHHTGGCPKTEETR